MRLAKMFDLKSFAECCFRVCDVQTPENVFAANSAKLAALDAEIAALNSAIAKCKAAI